MILTPEQIANSTLGFTGWHPALADITGGENMRLGPKPDTLTEVKAARALWTLPEPPPGQQWHRTDWTEDMLPKGWRPLLDGENSFNGDQFLCDGEWRTEYCARAKGTPIPSINWHNRTRRPIPTQPRMVPLERGDVPPGSCLSTTSGEGSWWAVLWAGNYLIVAELGRIEYEELQTKDFQIHRPGDNDADGKPVWRKCEKEATP